MPPPPPLGGIRDLPNASPQGPFESLKLEARKKSSVSGWSVSRPRGDCLWSFPSSQSSARWDLEGARWHPGVQNMWGFVRRTSYFNTMESLGEGHCTNTHGEANEESLNNAQTSLAPVVPLSALCRCVFACPFFSVVLKEITKSPFVHGVKNHQALPFTCSPKLT